MTRQKRRIRVTDRRKTCVLRREQSSRFCTPVVTHVEEETGPRYVSCLPAPVSRMDGDESSNILYILIIFYLKNQIGFA